MRGRWIVPSLALFTWSCVQPEPASAPSVGPSSEQPASFDLTTARVVDLTHVLDEETLFWPTSPSRFELETLAYGETEGGFFYSANRFAMPEHGGTHLDAPIHFAAERWTADQIPLDRLIAPAVVIDVSDAAAADADYRLSLADVEAWELEYGAVPEGAIVLLRTGWSGRWPDALAYLGSDIAGDASDLHFPAYGEAAARHLVESRRVAALGVDTASIDYGPSTDFIVHQVANGANVLGLENLTNLDQLPERGAWVVALPIKIGGGSGGPARVVGLIPPA